MTGHAAPRFRHLCLMAPTLGPGLATLQRLFSLAVAHRDPIVARWGIENAVLPVGHHFLELCAPIPTDAPAQRLPEPPTGRRRLHRSHRLRIPANVTDDFGNVTGLSGRC